MFRKDLTVVQCAKLMNTWETHRGADGEENVFDLEDKKDFRFMVRKRGYFTACKMRKKNRFWFDGNNFDEKPVEFPNTEETARDCVENSIESRYVHECPELYVPYL